MVQKKYLITVHIQILLVLNKQSKSPVKPAICKQTRFSCWVSRQVKFLISFNTWCFDTDERLMRFWQESGVGKSSIAQRYVHDNFRPAQESTIGWVTSDADCSLLSVPIAPQCKPHICAPPPHTLRAPAEFLAGFSHPFPNGRWPFLCGSSTLTFCLHISRVTSRSDVLTQCSVQLFP